MAADFSPVYLRNATVYGAGPRLRFDLVVNNLTAWAVATGAIRMKSDGTPWRPLVHVEDVSRAVVSVLEADRDAVHNEAFNVGREGENYQIRDVATIVGEEVPDCEVSFADGASPTRARTKSASPRSPSDFPSGARHGPSVTASAKSATRWQAWTSSPPTSRGLATPESPTSARFPQDGASPTSAGPTRGRQALAAGPPFTPPRA